MANDLEQQLGAVLNDPEMMSRIMSMARAVSRSAPDTEKKDPPPLPDTDLSMIQKIAGLAAQSGIDQHQRSLLTALSPYLSGARLRKLENAMRAARMTRLASGLLASQERTIGR